MKQTTKDSGGIADDEDDDDDDEPSKDSGDRLHVYNEMLKLMKPGESVLKSLRRLGGGKAGMAAASASRRWKEKRAAAQGGNKSTSAPEVNRTDLLALTGHADRQLQQGNLEIYQATYEKLAFDVSEMEKANADAEAERRTVIPQGIEDDDALDMFADSFDTKGDTKGDAVSKEKDATEQTQNGKLFFLLLVDFRSCDVVLFVLLCLMAAPSIPTIFSCDVLKGTSSGEVWQL